MRSGSMNPQRLSELILPHIDHVMIDPLNYRSRVAPLFRQHGWEHELTDDYAAKTSAVLCRLLGAKMNRGG